MSSDDDDEPIFDLTNSGGQDRKPRQRRAKPAAEREVLPPSDKQIAFARKLAEERGQAVPLDVETDRRACSEFIDRMLAAPKAGAPSGVRPPSDKQLAFVAKLAAERGIEVPDDAKTDAKACSALIDRLLAEKAGPATTPAAPTPAPAKAKSAASKAPSDKQIAYAQKLAREKKLRLPAGYQSDWRICRDFIDTALGKTPPEPDAGGREGPPW